ncbi:hypothetical protein FRC12_023698 [Ceratobasidium sp. 428]|nr:hypothetical protein FRC12_023698 [Ceratobasidium sp. 428]
MKFIAVLVMIIVSISAAVIVPRGGIPLTHQVAQAKLEAAGIYMTSTGNCTDWWIVKCTSYEGILSGTVDNVIALHNASGCSILITGATEVGHPNVYYGHFNGYAVNMQKNQCLYDYVNKYFNKISNNSWKSVAGNLYILGTYAWDITYY